MSCSSLHWHPGRRQPRRVSGLVPLVACPACTPVPVASQIAQSVDRHGVSSEPLSVAWTTAVTFPAMPGAARGSLLATSIVVAIVTTRPPLLCSIPSGRHLEHLALPTNPFVLLQIHFFRLLVDCIAILLSLRPTPHFRTLKFTYTGSCPHFLLIQSTALVYTCIYLDLFVL